MCPLRQPCSTVDLKEEVRNVSNKHLYKHFTITRLSSQESHINCLTASDNLKIFLHGVTTVNFVHLRIHSKWFSSHGKKIP